MKIKTWDKNGYAGEVEIETEFEKDISKATTTEQKITAILKHLGINSV